ncbi:uncharacterized protein METZ01_LOCUS501105 [marine metagenome]|uniref:Uncharacterized protein n=1 Tax=marine metagenome TaxID=408172 RepID=A0A383DUT6_9ZZZZ
MNRRTGFQEQRGTSVTKAVGCYSAFASLPDHRFEFHLPEGSHGQGVAEHNVAPFHVLAVLAEHQPVPKKIVASWGLDSRVLTIHTISYRKSSLVTSTPNTLKLEPYKYSRSSIVV